MRGSANSDATANVAAVARKHLLIRAGRWSAALLAIALIVAGACGLYRSWRNQHLEKQASAFAARGDLPSAVLVARHLLQLESNNFVATRLMAELAERTGSAEAIDWRKRLVALRSDDSEQKIALAGTALRFGQVDLAAHTLEAIEKAARGSARCEQIAGAIALAQAQPEKAQECFARALEQEPYDLQLALNLATVQLGSNKPATAESARARLRQLAGEPQVRAAALRALTADALAHHLPDASKSSALLLQEKSPRFADYLLNLETARTVDETRSALEKTKAAVAGSAERVAELMSWMNRHDRAADALAWSGSLDGKLQATQPVPLAIAESMSCMRDWTALAQFVQNANWRDAEALRLAVQSHAVRHLERSESSVQAATIWRAAMKAAQTRPEQLAMMAKLAEGWGYRAEAAEVLWQIANGTIGAKEALAALQRIYNQTHDTRGLLRVAKRAVELNPNDLVAANNCASLGLLLNSDAGAQRIAEKLYNEHPANAAFAATYAFALHTEGKTADALRVIERLKEQQLRQPALAAYYVVMLAANGKIERARQFLPAAEHASLLPEEKTLLAEAARKLNASS